MRRLPFCQREGDCRLQAQTEHAAKFDDPWDRLDAVIAYSSKVDEYGLLVRDGGRKMVRIYHCPWCGSNLPESKRALWEKVLAEMGIDDPMANPRVPEAYRSDKWWRE